MKLNRYITELCAKITEIIRMKKTVINIFSIYMSLNFLHAVYTKLSILVNLKTLMK